MTVKKQDPELKIQQELDARNNSVEKAFQQINQEVRSLLTPFNSAKYRTVILVDHSKSGKETNLISEFICCFFNLTLTINKAGYKMLYFRYDEESISRFGARLYNRALRQIFKITMSENTKANIEDCIRVNNTSNIQSFFINRLANGSNDFISIDVVDNVN